MVAAMLVDGISIYAVVIGVILICIVALFLVRS
jgi:hypothetical protein